MKFRIGLGRVHHTPAEAYDSVARATLIQAEYVALRDEIGRYQEHQRQLINAVFIVIGGTLTLAGNFGSNVIPPLVPASSLLLFVPPLYAMLALLYSDRAVRIVRLASYLHQHVRPLATSVAGFPVWEWETYKSTTKVVSRRVAFLLDKLRWSIFIGPLIATTVLTSLTAPQGDLVFLAGAIVDGVLSLIVAISAAVLTEETHGAVQDTRSIRQPKRAGRTR